MSDHHNQNPACPHSKEHSKIFQKQHQKFKLIHRVCTNNAFCFPARKKQSQEDFVMIYNEKLLILYN